jgi:uncharacterized protein YcfJ
MTTLQSCARYVKHFAIFTGITLGVTQCANTQDGRLTQAQGAGMGAVGGALLGAGIGALSGNSDAVKKGALIGAALGTAGGFAYGSHVANKKANYASTEKWLDACIADAESKRKAAVAYNSRLSNQLARLQKEVRMAKAAGDKAKLATLKREIVSERTAAQKEVKAFSKEAELQRGAISQAGGQGGSRLQTLKTSTSGIESQVSTMNRNYQSLASLESQATF